MKDDLAKIRKAPQDVYDGFRKHFAFACVDLVIFDGDGVLLTKRTNNPYRGYWHLPGSMIHKGEKIQDAVRRSAKEELNLTVRKLELLGVYESLNSYRHDVSHGFIVAVKPGRIKLDAQSNEYEFFSKLPARIIPHHRNLVRDAIAFRNKALRDKK